MHSGHCNPHTSVPRIGTLLKNNDSGGIGGLGSVGLPLAYGGSISLGVRIVRLDIEVVKLVSKSGSFGRSVDVSGTDSSPLIRSDVLSIIGSGYKGRESRST